MGEASAHLDPLDEARVFRGFEVELSTTFWMFSGFQYRSSKDDWSEVFTEVEYDVEPEYLYRLRLSALTRWTSISMAYETKQGLSFLDDRGTLLDLLIAFPWLDRWSTRYRRARFDAGEVKLFDELGLVEVQTFRFEIDQYELHYALDGPRGVAFSVFGRYQERAMPRQIFLKYSTPDDDENEEGDIFFDVSDQLLWVPTTVGELGLSIASAGQSSGFSGHFDFAFGLGGYELRTPLAGVLLDEGSLATVSAGAGLAYLLPMGRYFALRFAYALRMHVPLPIGLPEKMEDRLDDEFDASDFSLSFGGSDILQRSTISLIMTY